MGKKNRKQTAERAYLQAVKMFMQVSWQWQAQAQAQAQPASGAGKMPRRNGNHNSHNNNNQQQPLIPQLDGSSKMAKRPKGSCPHTPPTAPHLHLGHLSLGLLPFPHFFSFHIWSSIATAASAKARSTRWFPGESPLGSHPQNLGSRSSPIR